MKLTLSEPVFVHASTSSDAAIPDGHYYLSNLDQNVAVLMKTVHVFPRPSDERRRRSCDGDAAKVIKDALARALVHYYPFEGSLVVGADGRLAVRLRNDRRGVPFVEDVADCELRELWDDDHDKWVPGAAVGELVSVVVGDGELEENVLQAPLLTVQVTEFTCGGVVLGLALNHSLADGVATGEFLRSWGEAARGVPLTAPPFIDRTVLRARPPPRTAIGFPHGELEFAEMEDVSGIAALYSHEPCVHRAFHMDSGKLARLKLAAAATDEGRSGTSPFSTFVAMAAFVWRERTRALRMHPEQKSKLLFAVDGRRSLEPPLPQGYWGNAVVAACCISSAGDLLGEPLPAAVRAVQDAIERTDDRFIRSVVDYMEETRARPMWTATTLVTLWSQSGFCSVDFGWGEAVHFGPAELPQNELVVLQRNASGGMVVILRLPESCVKTFQDMFDLL